jgi:hypothetical protein
MGGKWQLLSAISLPFLLPERHCLHCVEAHLENLGATTSEKFQLPYKPRPMLDS